MPEYTWRDLDKPPLNTPEQLQAAHLWLLTGEEALLRHRFLEDLLGALLSEEERQWGLEVFGLSPSLLRSQPPAGTWARSIIRAASSLPFFSARRVVVVDEVQLLPADQQAELAAALPTLPASSTLVFTAADTGDKKKSRLATALLSAIKAGGNIVRFDPLKAEEAIRWVQEQAVKQGKRIEQSAAGMLVTQRLGTDLSSLEKELEKLVLFAGDQPAIKPAHVEEMTPRLLEDKIFDLTDAIALGRPGLARALMLLRRLMHDKSDAIWILATVSARFRLLWQAKALLERGWRPGQPAKETPGAELVLLNGKDSAAVAFARFHWQAQRAAEQGRKFSWPQLEHAMLVLARCDQELKGISIPPRTDPTLALELALIALCSEPTSK